MLFVSMAIALRTLEVRTMQRLFIVVVVVFGSTVVGQSIPELVPYALPPKTEQALVNLAGETDVLILGELHGTQEVPAVATALLAPLSVKSI